MGSTMCCHKWPIFQKRRHGINYFILQGSCKHFHISCSFWHVQCAMHLKFGGRVRDRPVYNTIYLCIRLVVFCIHRRTSLSSFWSTFVYRPNAKVFLKVGGGGLAKAPGRSPMCHWEYSFIGFFYRKLSQWMWLLSFYRLVVWPIPILVKHTSAGGHDASNEYSITSVCEIQVEIWTIW